MSNQQPASPVKKILVVDDDFFIRDIYEIEARNEGYEVISAADGEQALTQIKTQMPDMVLLDLMLPKLDGLTVIKQTRADPKTAKVPIIMITNMEDTTKEEEARASGVNDYLLKIRFTPTQVLEKVKAYFEANPSP